MPCCLLPIINVIQSTVAFMYQCVLQNQHSLLLVHLCTPFITQHTSAQNHYVQQVLNTLVCQCC